MVAALDGVLVVDKPQGPTSFDVVEKVRTALGQKKAGHTGTLDPMATGVLAICLGEATKVAAFLTEGDKAYDAQIRLGLETDTCDAQGKTLAESPARPGPEAIEAALASFRGTFAQVPPMFSAVKVRGKRLYEHARAGEEVERAARPVTVHELSWRRLDADRLSVSVRCSKGFFVRALAHDLGRALGCGAHLSALRRTASGPFNVAEAVPLDRLDPARLIPLGEALRDWPSLRVSSEDANRVKHGIRLSVNAEGRLRVLGPDSALLAVAEARSGRLEYLRVMR